MPKPPPAARPSLADPPSVLPGIGPARAATLAAAGIHTLGDLLLHLPHRWEDRSGGSGLADVVPGSAATVEGEIVDLERVFTRRRGLVIVRGAVRDGEARLPVVWFNRPYLLRQVVPGRRYRLHGPVRDGRGGPELQSPSLEPAETAVHAGRVVPVYESLAGLSPVALRRLLAPLAELDLAAIVADPLPEPLRRRHRLPSLGEALSFLHAPPEGADAGALAAGATPAHARLVYGELVAQQVRVARRRAARVARPKPHRYADPGATMAAVADFLPFLPTPAQRRAAAEIAADLASPAPMCRLLQGDVGAGKTAVAALALAAASRSGLQAALLAPTELLADQHLRSLGRLLPELPVVRLTGSGDAAAARARLRDGAAVVAVGTHALFQEATEFRRLALVVIDEQQRFGVAQRALLAAKGERPDVLVMTATPIPRSLALTAYGDLDLSLLDAMPPGRQPIATHLLPAGRTAKVYAAVRESLIAGERAFVVLPRIGEGDRDGGEAASIASRAPAIAAALAPARCAVVHGRMPAPERDRAMAAFAAGEVQALVATTVVEVGIDVPEATWMVIEGAEQLGLAQLHQLRGRVGRGERPSRCVALHGRLQPVARERLEAFAATADGFRLAELDLAQRGPGDVLGVRQAGAAGLRFARLPEHLPWLERAREDAAALYAAEPAVAAALAGPDRDGEAWGTL